VGDMDDRIVEEFLVESLENLDQLDRDLVALESDPTSAEHLQRVFRSVHTIKGTCGFLGFSRLESVAHAGEHLLARLRDRTLQLDLAIADALLALSDALRHIVTTLQEERREPPGDDAALIERLRMLAQDAAPGAAASAARAPAAPARPPAAAKRTGGAKANPGDGIDGERLFDPLVQSGRLAPEQLALAERQQRLGDPRRIGEILVSQGILQPQDVLDALALREERQVSVADRTIRVDVKLLDRLMNQVGELVLARNRLMQCVATDDAVALVHATQRLSHITSDLQEGMMKTRMQPVGRLWNKLPRVVRDLASACGKQVRLVFEGTDTELDKAILEAIRDPLTHLVRNAVDHGIETPEVRKACGKSPEGTLTLRASHEGGLVILEIADDGAGIPIERIKRKAVLKDLVPQDRIVHLTDREWIQFIFAPGFSTAENVTNVSGRGVGMDVVKTNVEHVGGAIEVRSAPNQGTTMRLKIPLTLAIIPALIVTDGGERFAIPQANLLELLRTDRGSGASGIEDAHGVPVLRLRDRLLPLVSLHGVLGTVHDESPIDDSGARSVAVVQSDGRAFGLIVEEVNDSQEIVVKPLRDRLRRSAAFAGATILGDGSVALILDVPGLARLAGLGEGAPERATWVAPHRVEAAAERQALLAFRIRQDWPAAIALGALARLEEFPASAIERVGDRDVVRYRGRILPLVHVATLLDPATATTSRAESRASVPVIVHVDGDRRVGVVVEEILDVVDQTVTVAPGPARPGVIGSAVIHDRVTDLLDLDALVRSAVGLEGGLLR
jgi:two-component system, chemotaxis family, sensor kinase CheA